MSAESQTSTSFVAKSSDTHQWEGCPWNSFAGSVITEAGSAVHRTQLVLEVADALVDGERPSQSCLLQQQREIGRSARQERSGRCRRDTQFGLRAAAPLAPLAVAFSRC